MVKNRVPKTEFLGCSPDIHNFRTESFKLDCLVLYYSINCFHNFKLRQNLVQLGFPPNEEIFEIENFPPASEFAFSSTLVERQKKLKVKVGR